MYFGSGKRKGKSAYKIVDVSNKRSKSTVNLPSLPISSKEEEVCEAAADDDTTGVSDWSGDEDTEEATLSTPYQQRKERLSKNWQALRMTLLQSSLRMEGFIHHKCVESDCDRDAITRCRDCSFGSYYCMECCNRLHQTKHHFHQPEVKKVCFASIMCRILVHVQ